jgi:L-serine dehydratase
MYWWRFLADSGLGAGNAVTPYGELVGSALLGFAGGPQPGPVVPDVIDDELIADANRRRGIRRFLLTATALGSLFKANASISGAEGGCQAEVGSACAMAAGGLTAVMGGTNRQIENAAEIAMEHHLGLTCDPVGGLVQIPCIERNAIAASTAVTAARLALRGDGSHYVSLDAVVETMRQTGIDMSHKYKETSEGGLAVNVIEC